MIPFFSHLLALLPLVLLASANSDYHERLLLRPLPNAAALLASFSFRSNASATAFHTQHYRLFPRSLGQILQYTHTKELHLRFTVGRWEDEDWSSSSSGGSSYSGGGGGPRPWQGAREGGSGVELWAWVEADDNAQATERWAMLTNALSGLFCASLNFIDSTRTIRPARVFEPEGTHFDETRGSLHLLHGVLPHEVVCTENLTPFLKLLPCKDKAGIASLLDGHKLFDASYQSMAVDVRPVCNVDDSSGAVDLETCVVQIEQTVDMVLDLDRSRRPQDNPIPRPLPIEDIECDTSQSYNSHDACLPLYKPFHHQAWNLTEIFGKSLAGPCPFVANTPPESTTVCLNVPPERTVNITGDTSRRLTVDNGYLRCFEPASNIPDGFSLQLPEQRIDPSDAATAAATTKNDQLRVHRAITGYGQERGGFQTVIHNPSSTCAREVLYLESLPWYMKPYLHTLAATVSPLVAAATNGSSSVPVLTWSSTTIKDIVYRPALDRTRGTHLEVHLLIPPAATLSLTYDFDKAILRYTEYPPDANRGFDVAAAVVRILPPPFADNADNADCGNFDVDTRRRGGIYLRTTTLLLPLPTPDFSMPYNVIILTSTVMALGFGGIFNILTRRFVGVEESNAAAAAGDQKKGLAKLVALAQSAWWMIRRRQDGDESHEKTE